MDLAASVVSTGWAAGINAYLTVAVLGLLGRAGVGEVPSELTSDGVIIAALVMTAVEFVLDKIPYVDNLWDLVGTAVRPAVASWIGVGLAGEADVQGLDEALTVAGSGGIALASHGVKSGLRLAINTSPEPFSNIITSVAEDIAVAGVTLFALEYPVAAALIAAFLLITGALLVWFLFSRIKRVAAYLRTRYIRAGPT